MTEQMKDWLVRKGHLGSRVGTGWRGPNHNTKNSEGQSESGHKPVLNQTRPQNNSPSLVSPVTSEGEPRLRLKFKMDDSLRAEVRGAKVHLLWDTTRKCWHIPEAEWAVRRLMNVLENHHFDTESLIPYLFPMPDPTDTPWIKARSDSLGLHIPWTHKADVREALMTAIKGIPGRFWDVTEKRWHIPTKSTMMAIHILERFVPPLAKAIRDAKYYEKWEEEESHRQDLSSAQTLADFGDEFAWIEEQIDALTPDHLQLYPFQNACVAFIELTQGKCIIGDEPGMGKTMESLAYTLLHEGRTLVVCPSNVKFNWANEIRLWNPEASVAVYMATMTKRDSKSWEAKGVRILRKGDPIPPDLDYLIINYDHVHGTQKKATQDSFPEIILKPIAQKIHDSGWTHMIVDESHLLKNWKTQRTKGCVKIAEDMQSVICMSGTPIKSHPHEFYTTLRLIKPVEFPSWQDFVLRYCGAYQNEYGLQIGDPTNWLELHSRLKSCMIRRKKVDVLKDLPSKIRQIVEVPMDDPAAYFKVEKQLYWQLFNEPGGELQKISVLRLEAARQKLSSVLSMIETVRSSEGSVVVFYHHKEIGEWLQEGYPDAFRIDGSTPSSARADLVEGFQAKRTDVILCSTLAGGIGITLTAAATCVFAEPEWTPSDVLQAEDRLHRVGQDRPVTAIHIKAVDSIDEMFYDYLKERSDHVSQVLDGEVVSNQPFMSTTRNWLNRRYEK